MTRLYQIGRTLPNFSSALRSKRLNQGKRMLFFLALSFFAFNANAFGETIENSPSKQNALFSCPSETLVSYNLDACLSERTGSSKRDYSEFTPTFPNTAGCNNVSASIVSRNDGSHSCVAGANGSPAAICVPTDGRSSFTADDDDAVRFEITVNSGSTGQLTELKFYELSPRNYLHNSGASGVNDYARQFGVRILKDGREVFRETGINTSKDNWTLRRFDLSNDADFTFSGTTTYSFEILGYNPLDRNGNGSFFDVDEIMISGSCGTCDPCDGQGGDSDGDGICDNQDNCPDNSNANQADNDGDNIGNTCDNCPSNSNANQADNDGDNIGNTCDNCPNNSNANQADNDGDNIGNACDNCPNNSNANQADNDGDGIGNACDSTPDGEPTCDADGGRLTGGPFNFCVSNGEADNIPSNGIARSGSRGSIRRWVITDDQNNILGLPGSFSDVNFDDAGQGVCLVWYIAYENGLTGLAAGQNLNNLQGCYDLSNPIDVVREICPPSCDVDGGRLTGGPFSFCVSNGEADNIPAGGISLSGGNGSNRGWVVTDDQNNILGLPPTFSAVDFDGAGEGVCLVWYLAYENGLTGLAAGQNLNSLQGCYDLSNPISVVREICGAGGDCNSVTVVGEAGKVTITNIPSDAKIEISGPATGYGQQLVCEGNCASMEMVNGLTAGNYNVTIQTFNPYCYNLVSVTVTGGGGGGNPCDNQGGDSDGDGICDNQDNCDFNANPDQADNDGDGIGNACDDTPNGGGGGTGGDCNSVTVVGEAGKVTITDIPSDAKIEISGPATGYGQQLVCEGNCASMEMVNGLTAGNYNVTIQTFNPYCYNQVGVTVTGGGSGGNPCDGQGGDSDGDSICDNQDNCDFNANPDQADNDGDGIGNACDDTPNGGGGGTGGDCNSVTVVGEAGKVTITDIPSDAKIEISGPATGYGQQLVCEGNCASMEMVNGLSAGNYNVTIQTFNPYCYNRVTVTVTGGGSGGNPCDGQGGDSDGDGICDNQDNCDFNANPDQADNDGDGIGNACDDTPNGGGGGTGGDCNSVTVVGEAGKVTITDIPSDAKIEISGPATGYGQQLVCEGNCASMEMVNGLSAGNYNVTIQTFNPYCYNRVTVTVTGGGGGGNPCDGQGGDSDGDGICDNQDNCDFNANPDQVDNDGDGIGNACDDTPNGGGGGGTGGDCNSVTAVGEAGKVTITDIPSDAKIEISGPATGYGQQLVCDGNCASMEMVTGLTEGNYNVTIQTFNPYCYNLVSVTVTGGGSGGNPCDGQGGDSDGDGICDNQDNCDFTFNPDQADNDGDGIGNACDDTPNGNAGCVKYRITDSAPECNGGLINAGPGVFFRRDCGNNFQTWRAGNDLMLLEFDNGTARIMGSITSGNSVGQVLINLSDQSQTGQNWTDNCYNNNLTAQYFYTSFTGTITVGNTVYNLRQKDNYVDFVLGPGANNESDGDFGVGAWIDGDWGNCIEFFGNLDLVTEGCGNATASSRNAPQLGFEAFRKNRSVATQWITNTGWKNNYFELEHSTDGVNFESIAKVMNEDITDDLTFYSDVDNTPTLGDNLYRIKQVYTDGSFDYSEVKLVNFNIDFDNLSMYPNPAQDLLNLNLKPIVGKSVEIQIMNTFGQVVYTNELGTVAQASVQIPLNDNIPNGFYQVFINVSGQKSITKKLMVKRLY